MGFHVSSGECSSLPSRRFELDMYFPQTCTIQLFLAQVISIQLLGTLTRDPDYSFKKGDPSADCGCWMQESFGVWGLQSRGCESLGEQRGFGALWLRIQEVKGFCDVSVFNSGVGTEYL